MFNLSSINDEPFIIAEVGQNHNGDLDLAREYIRTFSYEGADAIKFQTRDNKYLFSEEAYNADYNSENAFAKTYGAHREELELKPEWLPLLKKECALHGVKFMSTPFDEPSLSLLEAVDVDILKIASFDIGNIPLIGRIASLKKPLVISTGGGNLPQIKASVATILQWHDDIAILHCVSEYPCNYDRLGLDKIKTLIKEFPDCTIGSSDHFNGILSGPIAYMNGARVFEKHVTLNRASKGTDHSFALEPEGFKKFVRDVKRVQHMLLPKPSIELGKEDVFKKLGKSITAFIDIEAGEIITPDHLSGRIFSNQFIPVRQSSEIIGQRINRKRLKGEALQFEDFGW